MRSRFFILTENEMNGRSTSRVIFVVCLLMMPICAAAQKRISELPPAQTAAVQKYLAQQPSLEFLSESRMDQAILKDMRKTFGARLTPYYRAGDFNRDGVQDFAVVLIKQGPPAEDQGPGLAKTHRYRHEMAIVVFNGQKNGQYRVAFREKTTAPLVCLLNETSGKQKKLVFGVYETDEQFAILPSGTGYRVQ
jgi:hypothetical protein